MQEFFWLGNAWCNGSKLIIYFPRVVNQDFLFFQNQTGQLRLSSPTPANGCGRWPTAGSYNRGKAPECRKMPAVKKLPETALTFLTYFVIFKSHNHYTLGWPSPSWGHPTFLSFMLGRPVQSLTAPPVIAGGAPRTGQPPLRPKH